MGSTLSSIQRHRRSRKTTTGSTQKTPVRRGLPQRNGMCYYCSYASRESRRRCNYCGPGGVGSSSQYLVLPTKTRRVRQIRSFNVGRVAEQLRRPLEADGDPIRSAVDDPRNEPGEMEDGNDSVTNISVNILTGGPKSRHPDIVLTSADNSKPTMNLSTWAVLETDPIVVRAVNMHPKPPPSSKVGHGSDCACGKCKSAAFMSEYFARMMKMNDDGLSRCASNTTASREGSDGEEKGEEPSDESQNSRAGMATERRNAQPSTARNFPEEISNPAEPAPSSPRENTISPKRGNDSLRETYVAHGGQLQDCLWISSAPMMV